MAAPGVSIPKPVTPPKTTSDSQPAGQNSPFSQEQLANAWTQLQSLPAFQGSERLLAVLSNIAPTLTTMPAFKVVLLNTYQERDLNREKPVILQFLRRQLHNDGVRMEVEVNEMKVEKVPYTPQEKFNLMAQKNPNLLGFAQTFDLQFSS